MVFDKEPVQMAFERKPQTGKTNTQERNEREKVAGRTLETAFDGETDLIDMAAYKKTKIYDLPFIRRDSPIDLEAIKLRQDTIEKLLEFYSREPDTFKEVQKSIGRLTKFLRQSEIKISDDSEDIDSNIDVVSIYIKDRVRVPFHQTFEKVTGAIGLVGETEFIKEFREAVEKYKKHLSEFQKLIKEEDCLGELEEFKRINQEVRKRVLSETWEKSLGQARNEAKERYLEMVMTLQKRRRELASIIVKKLENLSRLFYATETVKSYGMNKVEINKDKPIEFKGACNPMLAQKIGWERVVRQDVAFEKARSNIVVTGDNATGKSKYVESILYNCFFAQNMGYAICESGTYSPRLEIKYVHSVEEEVGEAQYSRGQHEMKKLIEAVRDAKEDNVIIMDEVLTSTDSMGAIALVIAALEKNAEKKGGISILTVHSRDLEKIRQKNIAPSIKFLRAVEGEGDKKTYRWEEGVARADALKLAKSLGMEDDVLARAAEIMREMETE